MENQFLDIIRGLLNEAYEGVETGKPVWFSDPGTGLFTTLERVSAQQASRALYKGGSTIAAHSEHLRWSLALTNAFARGEPPAQIHWSESWSVKKVDDAAWKDLKNRLTLEFHTVRSTLPPQPDLTNPMFVSSAVGMVAHAAYHLAAIRQMWAVLEHS